MTDIDALLVSSESESVECKETWGDDCLKALAALANRRGGVLLVGVSDDRKRIPGWHGDGKEQERVSNQVVSTLHIHPLSLAVQDHRGTPVLVVEMPRASSPVAVRGRYYRRVGNSTREVPTEELTRFLLERTGQFWDGLACEAGLDALSEKALADFKVEAQPRLPALSPADAPERVLDNLDLRAANGRLRRAAVMLFGKPHEPQRVALTAQVHMGRFKDAITILDDKMLGGNLFEQLDAVMSQFRQYLQVRYEFHKQMGDMRGLEAMRRIETWDYPLGALREAVANALLHRDYTSSGQIMIQVFDDQVIISNPGGLPDDLTVEDLRRPHRSHPRNPLMAQTFYFASVVERWGSGTTRMAELCRAQGLPEPEFVSTRHTFTVTFSKDLYTEERLRAQGLSERQIRAVRYVREKGAISNAEYQKLVGISRRTATRDLTALSAQQVLQPQGEVGQAVRYTLCGIGMGQIGHERAMNAPRH